MGQKMTIRILNRTFPYEAESPEQERHFREAAEKVDKKYHEYMNRYPDKSAEERLSIIAWNGFVEVAVLESKLQSKKKDEEILSARLKSYLKNIDK